MKYEPMPETDCAHEAMDNMEPDMSTESRGYAYATFQIVTWILAIGLVLSQFE